MTIVDFYQELSNMLEQARSSRLSKEDALNRLDQMTQEMQNQGIQVDISRDIFDFNNLVKFDDDVCEVARLTEYGWISNDGLDFDYGSDIPTHYKLLPDDPNDV
jgi:hypothetical protein